jgi:hypothetical protein
MIKSVRFISNSENRDCPFVESGSKVVIDLSGIAMKVDAFDLAITLSQTISAVRNHDYTWITPERDILAGPFGPKVIRLADGSFIQANLNIGFWEVRKNAPNVLHWRFYPADSAPLAVYKGEHNERSIEQAKTDYQFAENPALLFSDEAFEFSRSPIPFSAIACFTDHCDFDTAGNLKVQREFFKELGVKVTKGFFLNDYSKRENASFETDADELTQWRTDGHELAYHSLSQSIKPTAESLEDFFSFTPPFPDLPTYIDHGYQPYNFSLFRENKITSADYEKTLIEKNITTLWNYVDSGTATTGVINQLNSSDFTLSRFMKGNADLGFAKKISLVVKNIMFHYYSDEKIILSYKKTASGFKKVFYQKKLGGILQLVKNFVGLSIPILKVFVNWRSCKNQPFRLARYTPLLFRHIISGREFYIFQTLEMVDFKKALDRQNIDRLIAEKGVFIAHTYFSVPMQYHAGRLLKTQDEVDERVAGNFRYLAGKIKSGELWNPTVNELVSFLAKFEKIILDQDSEGTIIVKNNEDIPYRKVV